MLQYLPYIYKVHGTRVYAASRKIVLLFTDISNERILTKFKSVIYPLPPVHSRYISVGSQNCKLHFHSHTNTHLKDRLQNIKIPPFVFPGCIFQDYQTRSFVCSRGCYEKQKQESSNEIKSKESQSEKQTQKLESSQKTENIFTIPNIITMSRIAATPYLGYLVLHEHFSWATGLFLLAGITDFIDGYIAKNFKNQMSVLGSALDPLADKLLISVLTVTLTIVNLIPVPLTLTIVGRDVILILASCYYRYISIQPPVTLSKYFNAKSATIKFYPSNISKLNTAVQISMVTLTLASPVFGYIDHPLLQALWYLTAATTVSSGLGYMINRKKHIQIQ